MDRVEQVRAARAAPQVAFTEYLRVRALAQRNIILVFEGRECPAFYIAKVAPIFQARPFFQLSARGKQSVLQLRDLVHRNLATRDDLVLYFVDQDFDTDPRPGDFEDVYVTRGYAIENELVCWEAVEKFMRAHLDIADADDAAAIEAVREMFENILGSYITKSRELHKIVFLCRRFRVRCLPGEDIEPFLSIDWVGHCVVERHGSIDTMLNALGVPELSRELVTEQLEVVGEFEALVPILGWRGKYHYSLLRRFLIHIAERRLNGEAPFARSSRLTMDPSHSGLFSVLSAFVACPTCLDSFVRAYLTVH